MILPLALMALMVLAAQAAALLAIGTSDVQIAASHFQATQALFLAEAGIEDAFNALRTAGALAAAPASPGPMRGLSGPGPTFAAIGTYDVLYQTSGPNTVRVIATGTARQGGKRVLRATMTTQFAGTMALLDNGPLTIEGTASIIGRCGAVHANGALELGGSLVEIQVTASSAGTATGTYRTPSGSTAISPVANQPRVATPSVSAARLLAAAQADAVAGAALYQLSRDGSVLRWNMAARQFESLEDQTTPAGARTILRGSSPGWEWSRAPDMPAQWRLTDASAPSGTFYVEGDVSISGDPGNSNALGPPWTATVIAADVEPPGAAARGGNVVVSGNPRVNAHLPDVVIATDRDIAITGSPSAGTYTGLLLAHEQIQITGNATIIGALFAEDAEALGSIVPGPGSRISGSATITYDCGAVAPLDGPLTIAAWGW